MEYLLETLGKVGFDWRMALFSFINFILVFWLLKKLFFKKILNIIEERQESIKKGLENFEKSKIEIEDAGKKANTIIIEAKKEANGIIEQANEMIKIENEKMKDKTKEDIKELVAQAKKNLEVQKQEMKEEIHKETVHLVISAVEKILDEKIDEKKDASFIKKMLESVK